MPFLIPPSSRIRRLLRLAAWNALFITVGLALLALGGEAYFRVTKPFMEQVYPREFVPGVGVLVSPNLEVQSTNRLDFWTVSRANSLGFLDREPPPGPAAGCPVAIIGDSFIEAREVPIADKVQVRLEEMAAAQLPHLNLTVSAYGRASTSQVVQLPWYDHYVRELRPRLVALVFIGNDVWNNHPVLHNLFTGQDPQHSQTFSVARRPDGTLELRPPDPEYWKFNLPTPPRSQYLSWADRTLRQAGKISWFARWLSAKKKSLFPPELYVLDHQANRELLSRRPQYAAILDDARLTAYADKDLAEQLADGDLSPIYAEALEYTDFALAQFRERADRDGAELVILASHNLKVDGNTGVFDWLRETAAAQGIPFIDQSDYIRRQGAALQDAQFRHDVHWNQQGHQWAAEALLEWIRENQQVCRPEPAAGPP